MSVLLTIKNFNLGCFLFSHLDKSVRPIFSLTAFKKDNKNVKVGDHVECKRCGRKRISYQR